MYFQFLAWLDDSQRKGSTMPKPTETTILSMRTSKLEALRRAAGVIKKTDWAIKCGIGYRAYFDMIKGKKSSEKPYHVKAGQLAMLTLAAGRGTAEFLPKDLQVLAAQIAVAVMNDASKSSQLHIVERSLRSSVGIGSANIDDVLDIVG